MSDDADADADPVVAAAPRRERDWNALSALIAVLIGMLALAVSGYTAWLQRQQVRAQVWPYLEPAVSKASRDVLMVNKGIGPAIVHRVQLTVDDRPQRDWRSAFDALGIEKVPPSSTLSGVVVAPGQQIRQLVFPELADYQAFMQHYARIALRVCYCSALGECWVMDQRQQDVTRQREPVDACPGPSDQDFIDNK
jgi:hypothetical protein